MSGSFSLIKVAGMGVQSTILLSILMYILMHRSRVLVETALIYMHIGIGESGEVSPFDQIALVRLQGAAALA